MKFFVSERDYSGNLIVKVVDQDHCAWFFGSLCTLNMGFSADELKVCRVKIKKIIQDAQT